MTYEELLGWFDYFEKRPIDWRSDDHTFKVLQTQGVKEKPWAIFPSLKSIYNSSDTKSEKLPSSTLKNSSLFSKMLIS